ncbi:hypothetical protein JY97_00645 [Alkalispirochaeta odontotermitis]|nr:hypothetical protein JY97_00645 [Alkalispirochaeta odontotermitis]
MAEYDQEQDGVDEEELAGRIANEIAYAIDYDESELAAKRVQAFEYYRGEMNDTPPMPNGSEFASRDFADTMNWMLPGIIRVFTGSDNMASFSPAESGDEDAAKQAAEYSTFVFFNDNKGYEILYNATHDALMSGDGFVKTYWDDTPKTEISFHSGLIIDQIALLTQDEDVSVLAQEVDGSAPAMVQDPETGEMIEGEQETYSIKIERIKTHGTISIDVIEPENFLIDDRSLDIDTSRFCAHRDPYVTKSDLIERGFDYDTVMDLPADNSVIADSERLARHNEDVSFNIEGDESTQIVDLYECYIRMDADGDGVSELVQVFYAGNRGGGKILQWDVWEDDVPFTKIPCYPRPHRFDSESVFDRTKDVQQIKTILTRQSLDNLYASNLPMREVEQGAVLNPDILVNPKFGGLIWRKPGSNPVIPHQVPFVADKSFEAIQHFEQVIEKRTGVSRSTMALDPDALQNQTATSVQIGKDSSYSQIELVARNMAELGWTRVFKKLLRLMIKHQDRARTIRLRDEFVEIDPRHWNADMDVVINVGLGTGSRDRDMAMLSNILRTQLEASDRMQMAFPDKAVEMIPKIRDTMVRIAEASGLRNPDDYYPDFTEEDIAAMQQRVKEQAQQEPPEIALEKMKIELQAEIEQVKAQAAVSKENAQMQADLRVEERRTQNDMIIREQDLEFKNRQLDAQTDLKREEIASRERIEAAKLMEKRGGTQPTAA